MEKALVICIRRSLSVEVIYIERKMNVRNSDLRYDYECWSRKN
jgi:hypothetical protein